jgi:hypothetical protein
MVLLDGFHNSTTLITNRVGLIIPKFAATENMHYHEAWAIILKEAMFKL